MRRSLVLLGVACVAALAGCGSGSSSDGGPAGSSTTSLTFEVHTGASASDVRTVRLRCPDASSAAACAALKKVAPAMFLPVPKGRMCSMLYAGPQTATVTGTYEGRPVSASFRRTNGCETARWGSLQTVLTRLGVPAP